MSGVIEVHDTSTAPVKDNMRVCACVDGRLTTFTTTITHTSTHPPTNAPTQTHTHTSTHIKTSET